MNETEIPLYHLRTTMDPIATSLDNDLISQICDHLPESVVWVKPVWGDEGPTEEKEIIDFEFQYCNHTTEKITGKAPGELIGKRMRADRLPDPASVQLIFEQCLNVYTTGQPLEYTYFSTGLDKYLSLHRTKVGDGVLTSTRDRTVDYKGGIEKEQQAKLLQGLVEHSPYGICLYESMRDEHGDIVDFRSKLCNKRSADLLSLPPDELKTLTLNELALTMQQPALLDTGRKVVNHSETGYLEWYLQASDRWLALSFVRFEDGYLLNFIDITATKKLEEESALHAQELHAIFNGSLSGVYSAEVQRDEEGVVKDLVFLRANDTFFKIFNVVPEQIIGKTLLSISDVDSQHQFIRYAQEVMFSGLPLKQELLYEHPKKWFEFSMVRLNERTISITVNDITVQKQASLEIERQKNLLDTIMKQSPNGLAITKAIRNESGEMIDASTVLMNEGCERINGIPNEVMLNNTFGSLSPEMLQSPLFQAAKELTTGTSFRTEYFLPQTNKWLELAIAKMDEDHFINVFTDITAVKDVQLELEQTVEELQRTNKNLEDFAYAASHDLKEPIRKIQFFAERIRAEYGELLDERGSKTFDRLQAAAERMKLLINDLLEYAQVDQGDQGIEEVQLSSVLQAVVDDLELVIQEKGAVVEIGQLPLIMGNPLQLQQLFQNLLGNALKYQKVGVPPQVRITSRLLPGKQMDFPIPADQQKQFFYLFEVTDNGIGFDQKEAERIFNVFTRLHGNTEYKGSGVGLSIVRKVVDHHKGFIKAVSTPGAGATFRVYLPAPVSA
ncbi:MAG TPA: ATP-binding protein [Flavisolibacter sp.]|nr:ATP-binding protein [Flavisolibacter sp.]